MQSFQEGASVLLPVCAEAAIHHFRYIMPSPTMCACLICYGYLNVNTCRKTKLSDICFY